jgi:hypothetical protein
MGDSVAVVVLTSTLAVLASSAPDGESVRSTPSVCESTLSSSALVALTPLHAAYDAPLTMEAQTNAVRIDFIVDPFCCGIFGVSRSAAPSKQSRAGGLWLTDFVPTELCPPLMGVAQRSDRTKALGQVGLATQR